MYCSSWWYVVVLLSRIFSLLQGEDNIEYYLGLTPSGIIVLRNRSKVGNYFWPRITKIYFKGKYFMLRVRDKNVSYKQLSEEKNYLSFCWKISRQPCLSLSQNEENTYGFETPSRQSCKHLWKCCVEHDAFFRLLQVSNKSYLCPSSHQFSVQEKIIICITSSLQG